MGCQRNTRPDASVVCRDVQAVLRIGNVPDTVFEVFMRQMENSAHVRSPISRHCGPGGGVHQVVCQL
jgi:hypothetical protein